MSTNKHITIWRKAAPDNLDWDFHVSEDIETAKIVLKNLETQGIHQYRTYVLGEKLIDLSSEY